MNGKSMIGKSMNGKSWMAKPSPLGIFAAQGKAIGCGKERYHTDFEDRSRSCPTSRFVESIGERDREGLRLLGQRYIESL